MSLGPQRVAFVTGAASGIGAATATRLRSEGCTVVGFDRVGGDGIIQGDVSDPDSIASAVAATVEHHGRIDIACNIAGVLRMAPLEEIDLDEWHQMIAVNLTGPFLVSRAVLPHLVQSSGCMVNVGSISGLHGQPYNAAYCASKGGIVQLTRSLAVEFANRGVRINCVCPGPVDTPMVRGSTVPSGDQIDPRALARMMPLVAGVIDPSEIAAAINYLASEDAVSITGSTLVIDRGILAF